MPETWRTPRDALELDSHPPDSRARGYFRSPPNPFMALRLSGKTRTGAICRSVERSAPPHMSPAIPKTAGRVAHGWSIRRVTTLAEEMEKAENKEESDEGRETELLEIYPSRTRLPDNSPAAPTGANSLLQNVQSSPAPYR